MNRKQKIIVSVVGITIVLLALLGITYAYYLTRIEGNTNTNSISITTADLKLVYSENDGIITANNIMPGTAIEKNFTVTNDGNNKVDSYAVYLEELINTLSRTEDLTYVLTCESTSGTCNGSEGDFPTLADILVTNSIDTGVTHTYKLTVTYANHETIDQSDDMGSTISALVQIYALEDIVDIEGSVTGASDGDFAQINSIQKRSQIVDGKYKFAGVLPGTHTIKICSKDDTNCTSPNLTKEIIVNLGTVAGVDGNTLTITDDSQTATIDVDLTQAVESNRVIIVTTIKDYIPFKDGTLAYKIYSNAKSASGDRTVYSPEPLSTPISSISGENERTLSIIEDDYGTSYYFRGNVVDNYLTFNNMCWRIVRIQGDGSVKIILADDSNPCSGKTYSTTDGSSSFIGLGYFDARHFATGTTIINAYGSGGSGFVEDILDTWLSNNFDNTSLLKVKSENYNVGDMETIVTFNSSDSVDYGITASENITNYLTNNGGHYYWGITYKPAIKGNFKTYENSLDKTSKIGLINVNEIIYAGATESSGNSNYYLYTNASSPTLNNANDVQQPNDGYWLTLNVKGFAVGYDTDYVYGVSNLGKVDTYYQWTHAHGTGEVRPVIVLNSNVTVTGSGILNDPYIVN